ncbi:nuclear transport factor 2 family protein [Spongiivirga citrea]|uniref:DUF4440 domain-containing protein n=1 Tax=Spongiivirga citrea TaxID=1481457 RepID=A0A6M0CD31_9FLAO|nr:nuclear transport factor 2 family protein [Spongiivirga citrea]NER15716.1 DUF4440 domain-containing protein [Spongiivirga citrea]
MKKQQYVLIFLLSITGFGNAQMHEKSDLYKTLRVQDSLLFNAAFSTCDTAYLENLFVEDFEFYHDKGGITKGRDTFLKPVKESCVQRDMNKPQPARRILIPGSLKVFPLRKNGVLYGAIQHGEHSFSSLNNDGVYVPGDIAKFTHVWILENKKWKLKRELSYDHQLQQ